MPAWTSTSRRSATMRSAYLDYFVLAADPVHGQHRGIFWVEVGVLVTVAGVMLKVFYLFAGRVSEAG